MKRSEVKQKYTWDLNGLFKSDDDCMASIKKLENLAKPVITLKGKLNTPENILKYINYDEKLDDETERVSAYVHFKRDLNGADPKSQEMESVLSSVLDKINEQSAFITPELLKNSDEFFDKLIKDERFKNWDYRLKRLKEHKKHALNETESEIMAKVSGFTGGFHDTFSALTDVDLKYGVIKYNGKKAPLTNGLISKILHSEKDAKLRKQAYEMRLNTYKNFNNTLAANYINQLKLNFAMSKIRKYKSTLKEALYYEDVDEKIYRGLLAEYSKNMNFLHEWYKLKKRILKTEIGPQDLYYPLAKLKPKEISYEDAYELTIKALKPLGKDYVELLIKARDERWIDVMETENKRSGAYSSGVSEPHPFVLLNFNGELSYTSTIAHEMGHCLHSVYSTKNQPKAKRDYKIILAEIASNVNEVLLSLHLLEEYKNDKEMRKWIISDFIDGFVMSFFRQILFAKFEEETHRLVEHGEAISNEKLNETFETLCKEQFSDIVSMGEYRKYEWSYIPHFYYFYYVYKYAVGNVVAIHFASKIYEEYKNGETKTLEQYKILLKSGCKTSPLEILKEAGVDLTKPDMYNNAFKFLWGMLDKLKSLI